MQCAVHIGCPTCIRADCGTENGLVAAVQYALRSYGDDSLAGEKSFRYGSSPANVVCLLTPCMHVNVVYLT